MGGQKQDFKLRAVKQKVIECFPHVIPGPSKNAIRERSVRKLHGHDHLFENRIEVGHPKLSHEHLLGHGASHAGLVL
jgi:hypothetical protein